MRTTNINTTALLTEPDAIKEYRRVMVRFMSWKHGKPVICGPSNLTFADGDAYPADHTFTTEELLEITPEDLRKWLSLMAYHNENPTRDDHPIYATLHSLKYTKKAVSYFMVHSNVPWNDVTRFGNPTRSKQVNSLLQHIKKLENADQGKPSNADRAFEYEEVVEAIKLLSMGSNTSTIERAMITCMFLYQIHFVARIDDMSKSKKQWLSSHPEYPHCLMGRLAWSKNVCERRDSPWQIIVGGDDWNLDVLLHFAIYLEMACESPFYRESPQSFFTRDGDTITRVKDRASSALKRKVIDKPHFRQIFQSTGRYSLSGEKHKAAKLGSHSFRKYAKTRARKSGVCSKDEVDLRGRWKQDNSKASALYEDTTMPFIDAKVAFQLCHGGPIGYELVPTSALTDAWIAGNVTPNTAAVYGAKMATVLGKALLWACCDNDAKSIVDRTMLERVLVAYHGIRHGDSNSNPVQKVRLVLSESNGVAIIERCPLLHNQSENGERALISSGIDSRRLQAIENVLHVIQQNAINLQNTIVHEFEAHATILRRMDRLQKRMAAIPARAIRVGQAKTVVENEDERDDDRTNEGNVGASRDLLSRHPKDLHVLWREYQFGLDGRKPARQFTSVEKGKVSSVYSKRNKVWKLIDGLIRRRNEDYRVIIDSIYAVYGHISVTDIIKKIQRDEKNGGHPNLR